MAERVQELRRLGVGMPMEADPRLSGPLRAPTGGPDARRSRGAACWATFRVSGARDEVHVAAIEGGGLISFRKADGTFVHTLNTPDGFARKLAQLGISMPAGAEPPAGT